MTDLTEYGDAELDLWIQNDEPLYRAWNKAIDEAAYRGTHKAFNTFMDTYIDPLFIYNRSQCNSLEETFEQAIEEEQ